MKEKEPILEENNEVVKGLDKMMVDQGKKRIHGMHLREKMMIQGQEEDSEAIEAIGEA